MHVSFLIISSDFTTESSKRASGRVSVKRNLDLQLNSQSPNHLEGTPCPDTKISSTITHKAYQ